MVAVELEEDLIHQLDNYDYACFEKNIDAILTWIKNQQKLKKQLLEKSNEYERLRCSLNNANEEINKLYSLCDDFLQSSNSLLSNSPSKEFLDSPNNQTTSAVQFENVRSERDCSRISPDGLTAGNPIDEIEIQTQDNFVEHLLNYDSQERERLELKLEKTNEECRSLKTQYEVVNEELMKTNESLNAEKMIRSKVETERDSLACLSEKLELTLLKYEQYFSSADNGKVDLTMASRFKSKDPIKAGSSSKSTQAHETECCFQKPFQCSICNRRFAFDSCENRRSRTMHKNAVASCLHCNRKFNSKNDLAGHLEIYNHKFCCSFCYREVSRKRNLGRYITTQHLPLEKGKSHKVFLKAPEATHSNSQKPFPCSICDKSFTNASNRRHHIRAIHEDVKASCSHCNRKFTQKKSLKNHIMTQHFPVSKKLYKCTTCGKSFALKSNLNQHQAVHVSKKLYKCTTCGKSFATESYLNRHQLVHVSKKLYKCTTCAKSFALKSYLNQHQAVHVSKKLYKCTTCGKSCARKSDLNRHQAVHVSKKLYKCTTCGKSFAMKSYLNQHQVVHVLERVHKCSICEKSFKTRRIKFQHEQEMHSNFRFFCANCDKGFRRKCYLLLHLKRHHSKLDV